jgi:FkbM family methyltransferase
MPEGNVLSAPEGQRGFQAHEDLVFDVGMNICEDTDFYLKKGFRVVAVEANPSACLEAERRYPGEVASGQLTILNRAISGARAPLRFFVCRTMSAWSTASTALRDQWARQGAVFEEIEVPGMSSADLIADYGVPRYAKVDIEGFDLICLRGFQAVSAAPRYLSVEVDFYTVDELLGVLKGLGYRRYALVGQAGVANQRAPAAAKEGRAVAYEFKSGCSGLFGEELPAPWGDAGAVRARCAAVVTQHRIAGALDRLGGVPLVGGALARLKDRRLPLARDWYDIHAAL